jgi:hypothetical protein
MGFFFLDKTMFLAVLQIRIWYHFDATPAPGMENDAAL